MDFGSLYEDVKADPEGVIEDAILMYVLHRASGGMGIRDALRNVSDGIRVWGSQAAESVPEKSFIIDGDVIRFDASKARLASAPSKSSGLGSSPDTLATLNKSGEVVVIEGKHRVNLVLEGKTFAESVPGNPGWLEYNYDPDHPAPTGVPAGTWTQPLNKTAPLLNPKNPFEGMDGY